jgi:hypothetical protein
MNLRSRSPTSAGSWPAGTSHAGVRPASRATPTSYWRWRINRDVRSNRPEGSSRQNHEWTAATPSIRLTIGDAVRWNERTEIVGDVDTLLRPSKTSPAGEVEGDHRTRRDSHGLCLGPLMVAGAIGADEVPMVLRHGTWRTLVVGVLVHPAPSTQRTVHLVGHERRLSGTDVRHRDSESCSTFNAPWRSRA